MEAKSSRHFFVRAFTRIQKPTNQRTDPRTYWFLVCWKPTVNEIRRQFVQLRVCVANRLIQVCIGEKEPIARLVEAHDTIKMGSIGCRIRQRLMNEPHLSRTRSPPANILRRVVSKEQCLLHRLSLMRHTAKQYFKPHKVTAVRFDFLETNLGSGCICLSMVCAVFECFTDGS